MIAPQKVWGRVPPNRAPVRIRWLSHISEGGSCPAFRGSMRKKSRSQNGAAKRFSGGRSKAGRRLGALADDPEGETGMRMGACEKYLDTRRQRGKRTEGNGRAVQKAPPAGPGEPRAEGGGGDRERPRLIRRYTPSPCPPSGGGRQSRGRPGIRSRSRGHTVWRGRKRQALLPRAP